mmetsp:Transcript_19748/g.32750  ORF Transcript_19748/g.32750 Transcript_19748/m.32750 type:complete len:299 (-) Transcript_19748:308-1204(-)
MMFRSLLVSSFFMNAVTSQCSVCGEDQQVGNPDAIFSFPNQPSVPCGLLQQAGDQGTIPLDQCIFLPPLISVCECEPVPPPTDAPVTKAPVATPTGSSIPSSFPSDTPSDVDITVSPIAEQIIPPPFASPVPTIVDFCSVCGYDMKVGNSDAIFNFPGQPLISCGVLEEAGAVGEFDPAACALLPILAEQVCECESSAYYAPSAPQYAPIAPVVAGGKGGKGGKGGGKGGMMMAGSGDGKGGMKSSGGVMSKKAAKKDKKGGKKDHKDSNKLKKNGGKKNGSKKGGGKKAMGGGNYTF